MKKISLLFAIAFLTFFGVKAFADEGVTLSTSASVMNVISTGSNVVISNTITALSGTLTISTASPSSVGVVSQNNNVLPTQPKVETNNTQGDGVNVNAGNAEKKSDVPTLPKVETNNTQGDGTNVKANDAEKKVVKPTDRSPYNTDTVSENSSLNINAKAPEATKITKINGVSTSSYITTNNSSLVFSGTSEPNVIVIINIFENSNKSNYDTCKTTSDKSGNWICNYKDKVLSAGIYTIRAIAQNAAGNILPQLTSNQIIFTLNTTPVTPKRSSGSKVTSYGYMPPVVTTGTYKAVTPPVVKNAPIVKSQKSVVVSEKKIENVLVDNFEEIANNTPENNLLMASAANSGVKLNSIPLFAWFGIIILVLSVVLVVRTTSTKKSNYN